MQKPDEPPRTTNLTFQIDPNGAFEALKRRVLRAHQAAWTTLQALQHPVPDTLDLPGSWMLHTGLKIAGQSEEDRRRDARAWILGNALADCIEGVQDLLTEVYKIYALLALPPDGVKRTAVHEALHRGPARFRRLGLREKSVKLLSKFGVSPIPLREWEHIKNINNVRNCLVHAGGIVTREYAVNGGVLRLAYHQMSFTVMSADGTEEKVWPEPHHVKGGALDLSAVGLQGRQLKRIAIEPREYTYRIGDSVEVAPAQFSWIIENVMQFGKAVVRGVVAHAKQIGLPVHNRGPDQPSKTVTAPDVDLWLGEADTASPGGSPPA